MSVISFSGVVGSGKSTAARQAVAALREAGMSAEYVRFQQFLALSERTAEVKRAPGKGGVSRVASPASRAGSQGERWPAYRRKRLLVPAATGYLLRAMLCRVRIRRWPAETVLVFDRYFYDNLVHFDWSSRGSARWLPVVARSIPRPKVAFLLLIAEETLHGRRPQYSIDYVRTMTKSYARLPEIFPYLHSIMTDHPEDTRQLVWEKIQNSFDASLNVSR